ncbi:MAG: hypothetical protein LBN00_11955 [Oscillospiraceae bacterium]|jgi:hypothetical protein|nr:hypothetical protein [Oscillospiraceae bacterium]
MKNRTRTIIIGVLAFVVIAAAGVTATALYANSAATANQVTRAGTAVRWNPDDPTLAEVLDVSIDGVYTRAVLPWIKRSRETANGGLMTVLGDLHQFSVTLSDGSYVCYPAATREEAVEVRSRMLLGK